MAARLPGTRSGKRASTNPQAGYVRPSLLRTYILATISGSQAGPRRAARETAYFACARGSSESDLLGHRIYRRVSPDSRRLLLMPGPQPEAACRDRAPAGAVAYTVTEVD